MPKFFQRVGAAVRSALDNPAVPLGAAAWMFDLFGGSPSSAGVTVNERTAMQHTTVYACINVLASAFSSLPCELLERKANGAKQPAFDSDLYYLLAVEPNPEMSAVSFWGAMMACAALRGNGYALIQWEKASRNKPVALWPIHPSHVQPRRTSGKVLEYVVTVDGKETIYDPKDLLHIPALTMDGFVGIDPIIAAKQSIGTGIAAGRHIAAFFQRGSRPSGILKRVQAPAAAAGTLAGKASPESLDAVRDSWERANAGDNQGRTAVLPAGWDWQAISITPEQAQHLQIMQYERADLAGFWQIPPHMIGDTSRLSNSNGESESLKFLTFTLRPWIVRFESEIQRKLLPKKGRNAGLFTIRFDTTEMLRLDFKSLIEAVAMGRQWGLYNANEGRGKLGDNPIEGKAGTTYLVPLNMVDAGQLTSMPIETDPNAGDVDPNKDTNPDDIPAGNGGQNQRKLLERMADAYRRLFRDGVGRFQARSVRSTDTVQQIFGPVLASIAEESERQARCLFRLSTEQDLGTEKLLRDTVKQLEKRTASWTATTADADADAALQYCVRAIALNVYREAGSALAQAA